MAIDFSGPRLKIERAEHHMDELESIFRQYVSDNMKRLRSRFNPEPTFPKHTPTVLGDAVHNLRASLDHAYHIVADANDAKFSDWRKFPFGKDRQSLAGSIKGHKQEGIAPSDNVIAAILDEIQPYEGGKLGLYGLHALDITDKHLGMIPTISRMKIERLDLVDGMGSEIQIYGLAVEMDQSKGGQLFSVASGEAVLHGDPKNTFQICFKKGQPFEGQGILDTIRSLKQATVETLDILLKAAS